MGKWYCTPCRSVCVNPSVFTHQPHPPNNSRYFISAEALAKHSTTKPHKRRCAPYVAQCCHLLRSAVIVPNHAILRLKELSGAKPHTALDAELAGGRGKPDNGPRLRSMPTSMDL